MSGDPKHPKILIAKVIEKDDDEVGTFRFCCERERVAQNQAAQQHDHTDAPTPDVVERVESISRQAVAELVKSFDRIHESLDDFRYELQSVHSEYLACLCHCRKASVEIASGFPPVRFHQSSVC